MVYDSLHEQLAKLPDETLVYPAHGAGSLCGKSLSPETASTIGEQRAENYALAPMGRARFVEIVTSDLPDAPGVLHLRRSAQLARAGDAGARAHARVATGDTRADAPARRTRRAPARYTRTGAVRARASPGPSTSACKANYASWCGTILDPHRPIVLIAEPGHELQAATRLGRIGFDSIAGYLAGGIESVDPTSQLSARPSRRWRFRIGIGEEDWHPRGYSLPQGTKAGRDAGDGRILTAMRGWLNCLRLCRRQRRALDCCGRVRRPLGVATAWLPDVLDSHTAQKKRSAAEASRPEPFAGDGRLGWRPGAASRRCAFAGEVHASDRCRAWRSAADRGERALPRAASI